MYSLTRPLAHPSRTGWAGVAAVLVAACSGTEVPPPPTAQAAGGAVQASVQDSAQAAQVEQMEMSREVFTYRGAARDPFRSLIESGLELRPFPEDLRVTSIMYDARYPGRSLATLRDTTQGKRYQVRVDDEFGRLRVAEIRETEVVLTMEEFGVPRQVVISLRRRQGGNQ
jgi:hypothetical protein